MKKKLLILPAIIIFGLIYFLTGNIDFSNITEITNQEVTSSIQDHGEIEVYFCPGEDCETVLVSFLDSAQESIHCALFDVGLESVQDKLLEKNEEIEVKVVTDEQYLHKFNHPFVKTDSWGLMHNKFCIIDGKKFSSGSMNPTDNGAHKNNNNLLLIESAILSQNYEAEFQEMWNGEFKKGEKVLNPVVKLGNVTVKNYFCPEDSCAYRVKEELKKAEKSIYLMTFSFTHEGIANILLLKHLDNLTIKGVMEARQVTKYSQFQRLEYQGIDVVKDGNKQNMHHKVWLIDTLSPECTIITGSMNPTRGGDTRNDENILIIKNDMNLCKLFKEEFDKIYNEAKNIE